MAYGLYSLYDTFFATIFKLVDDSDVMAHERIVGHLVPYRYYKLTRCKLLYVDVGVIKAKR